MGFSAAAYCEPMHPSIQHGRSASSHRSRLRRRGVPWLCTALRSVCSPLQPFGPPTASGRGGNAFFPQTQAFALQKMPEMTYTPSFLIRASFFRDFVNTLPFYRPSFNKTKNQAQGRLLLPCAWFLLSPSRRCPFKRRRPREFPALWSARARFLPAACRARHAPGLVGADMARG